MPGLTAQQLKAALVADPAGFLATTVIQFDLANGIAPHAWEDETRASRMIGPMLPNVHRPMRFRSTYRDSFTVEYGNGQNGWARGGDFYHVTPDGAGDQMAYFLPWRTDSGYSLVIGADAPLFFNAMMDGCSFGWTAGPNGTIRVAHHNIQGDDGRTDNAQMLQSLGMYQNRFMRNDYRNFGEGYGSCSIIGARGTNGWRIYAQVLSGGWGTYRIEQVIQLQ